MSDTQAVAPGPVFPFSAVFGQERLKLALTLCAVDPGIGGVLVRGPRGIAKTTLARGFAELLPGRFVELPLGASEERVTGSLDLSRALGHGEVQFAPGLLAHAHDGVLYVDEVNLLPDALVDLLLDAAATGRNVVERDGVSHAHAARFVLIGTMNPEEGELRPQLLDRFGLSVEADGALSPAARSAVVLRRLEFERDPQAFTAGYAREQQALIARARAARERVAELSFAGPAVAHAAELCHAAGVDGVRADLAMLRAARAHAAWHGRDEIRVSDVDAVAELALAHRRRARRGGTASGAASGGERVSPPSGRAGQGADVSEAPAPSDAASLGQPQPSGEEPGGTAGSSSSPAPLASERAGAMSPAGSAPTGSAPPQRSGRAPLAPVAVRASEPPALPGWFFAAHERRASAPRQAFQRRARGSQAAGEGAIDWFATLAGLAGRRFARACPTIADLRRRPRRLAPGGTWVIALDCSASMLQRRALASAKGAARALVTCAARGRARVVLLSFGGEEARLETGACAAPGTLERAIVGLGAAGSTPLRRAVQLGLRLAGAAPAAGERRFVLFTDGRSRDDVSGLAAAHPHVVSTLIDCERGPVRLGRARPIADRLAARYLHIDELWETGSPLPLERRPRGAWP
jgi:magnesium chelatase subunit D